MEAIIVSPVRYLHADELVFINGSVLNNQKILRGEIKIRDRERLEAAVARPASSAFGEDAYKSIQEKAASLMHSVARNHPFTDGNKRTAIMATIFILRVNGYDVDWNPADALEMVLNMAEGKMEMPVFADWLPIKPDKAYPEADAERDMEMIRALIQNHEWLLDELAER